MINLHFFSLYAQFCTQFAASRSTSQTVNIRRSSPWNALPGHLKNNTLSLSTFRC